MNIDYTKDVKVLGKVVSLSVDNVVAEAEQVFDTGFQYKTYGQANGGLDQHTINTLFKDTLIALANSGITPDNNGKLNLEVDNLHVLQNAAVDGVLVVNSINILDQINWLTQQVNSLIDSVSTLENCCASVNDYINSSHGGQNVFTVDPIGMSLVAGGNTGTVTAKINGTATNAVTWASSNTSVATVSNGTVTSGNTTGTATITATHTESQLTASCTVTVTEPERTWELVIVGDNRTIQVGQNTTLTAIIQEVGNTSNTKVEEITWSSSNTSVATITTPGATTTVSAVSVPSGQSSTQVVITARSASGLTASAGVSIYTAVEEPSTIAVNGYPTMYLNGTQTLEAVASPIVASNSVTWSSSDITKATVTTGGVVSALAKGNVTITATSTVKPSVSGSITIEIIDPADIAVSSVSIADITVNQGESLDVKQYTTMTQANGQRNIEYQKWSYSVNSAYATVDSTGWISGVALTSGLTGGYTPITVTYHDDVNNTTASGTGKVYVVSSGGDTPSTPAPNVNESLTLTVLNQGDIHVGDVVEVQVTSTPGIQSVYNSIATQYTGSNAGTPWWRLYVNGSTSGILNWTGSVDQYHNYPNHTSLDAYNSTPVYYYRPDGNGNYTTSSENGTLIGHNIINFPVSNADLNVPNSIVVKFIATGTGTITLTGTSTYTGYNLVGGTGTCQVTVVPATVNASSAQIILDEYQTITSLAGMQKSVVTVNEPVDNITGQHTVYVQETGLNCHQTDIAPSSGVIIVPFDGYIKVHGNILPSGANQNATWTVNGGTPLPTAQFPVDANNVITIEGNEYTNNPMAEYSTMVLELTSAEDPSISTSVTLVWQDSGSGQQTPGETRTVYVINDGAAMVSSDTNGSTYTIAANAASLPEASNGVLYADASTEPANLVNKQIAGGWSEPVQASFTITASPSVTLTAVLYERTNISSQHYQQVTSNLIQSGNTYTLRANLSNSGPYVLYINTTNA